MKLIPGYSVEEAVQRGALEVHPSASLASGIRIVPAEDDGTSAGPIRVGEGCRIREGVILCSGVTIGAHTVIGHQVVLRRGVRIGSDSVVSHLVCIERDARIGSRVRVSSLTHLTAECLVEDEVQIGARVVTINDSELRWRNTPDWKPPVFRRGCRVASGVTVMSGVEIGANALVGAGAVVTRSVPPGVVAYGVPAYVQRDLAPDEMHRPGASPAAAAAPEAKT